LCRYLCADPGGTAGDYTATIVWGDGATSAGTVAANGQGGFNVWGSYTFGNLYGAAAGANNLAGKTNAQVAAFFVTLFNAHGPKLDAQVLATALNVYATTLSLGGTNAQAYGFTVNAYGLGAYSYNVGSDGAAFGVANRATLNVYQVLKAANRQSPGTLLSVSRGSSRRSPAAR
jgi:hypothetical protein